MKTRSSTKSPTHTIPLYRWAGLLSAGPRARRRAFTRLELVVVLATLALLACLALPGLANNRPRSERVICVNNLRQIGQTFQAWATDHGGVPPWREGVVLLAPGQYDPEGGTRGHPLESQIWFQFTWLSNQLGTPKILACPADTLVRPARDWSNDVGTGFMDPLLRNNAVSYFLGLHVFSDYPRSILAGDHNLMVTAQGVTSCSSGVTPVDEIRPIDPLLPKLGWTIGVHGSSGDLLLMDGTVLQLSSPALRPVLIEAVPPFSTLHLLFPRGSTRVP